MNIKSVMPYWVYAMNTNFSPENPFMAFIPAKEASVNEHFIMADFILIFYIIYSRLLN